MWFKLEIMNYNIDHNKLIELTMDTKENSRYADLVALSVEHCLGLRSISSKREDPLEPIIEFLKGAGVLTEETK